MSSKLLNNTISKVLKALDKKTGSYYAIIGLDGFIDKIQKPVKSQDKSRSTYFRTLDSFGQRIREASEQSAQIELHTNTVKLGGNAPIFSNALAGLGIKNTCLGTFGFPKVHAVFQKMHAGCELVTLGNAAETNALEFNDGKLILSELSTFRDLNWARVKTTIDPLLLGKKAEKAHLIGLVDWCNLRHASDIWRGFFNDVVKPHVHQKPHFFFDLADPTKKSASEVREVVSIINRFSEFGLVTLGLNENETLKLAGFLDLKVQAEDEHTRLLKLGRLLFDFMAIEHLLIHPIDGCFLINAREEFYLDGRVVEQPVVSTGGGDNFNAGFCFGMLNSFGQIESMVTAMAASGAYVQNGRSPDLKALGKYLRQWLVEL